MTMNLKYMSETLNNWSTSHYNVMRTDPDNNKVRSRQAYSSHHQLIFGFASDSIKLNQNYYKSETAMLSGMEWTESTQ